MGVPSPYEDLMRHVHEHGVAKTDRTGTGTKSVFGHQMRFDLAQGFPLITTKKVFWKAVAVEPLWFLRGDDNVRWLQEPVCPLATSLSRGLSLVVSNSGDSSCLADGTGYAIVTYRRPARTHP